MFDYSTVLFVEPSYQSETQPDEASRSRLRRLFWHPEKARSFSEEGNVIPEHCPIFQTCSAALCPIDPTWPQTVHLPGEPVCRYLRASQKAGADDYYQADPVFRFAKEQQPHICARHRLIAVQVERASKSGIQGAHRRGMAIGDIEGGPATGETGFGGAQVQ